MISVALAIPHAPWMPGRQESFERLKNGLLPMPSWTSNTVFAKPAKNCDWSHELWSWAVETGAEWLLQLQDDAIVAPAFWETVQAMLAALPPDAEVVGLEVAHPASVELAREHRWFTTCDMLIGVGYVVRTSALKEFLEWRSTKLKPGAIEALTEDTMLGLWCMVTGRRIWHPLPTIIDHDTSLASTYQNDAHENRRPLVRWDTGNWDEDDALPLTSWQFWINRRATPHLGRFYDATPNLAFQWVEGISPADRARFRADDGASVLTGLRYKALSREYREPRYRLFLCTPHRGDEVSPEHADSVWKLMRLFGVDVHNETELVGARQEHQDLVRVRSRMVSIAYQIGATHLLFSDGDNAWEPSVVAAMLRTGKDFVQCPYQRRDGKGYSIRATEKDRKQGFTEQADVEPDGTIEIEHTGLGLTLLSRACLQQMIHAYAGKGLDYVDLVDGYPCNVVALFMLMIRDGVLLGEDTSFATRWRDIGGKVWLYIGEGSPIAHYGRHCYQGTIEELGFERAKKPKEAAE